MAERSPMDRLSQSHCIAPVEVISLPVIAQRHGPAPPAYRGSAMADWFDRSGMGVDRLWSHQAVSLAKIADGENLVLATGTASGKTLVFQAPIIASLLTSDTTHLVFYPQKALAADQLMRWREALERAGLPVDWVAEINGDIAMAQRADVAERARILLVTPDVVHAWLMRALSLPAIQSFLARLRYIVIDEAHALEGQFGSSAAFLLRRLLHARRGLAAQGPLQFIAATATIANPCEHLEDLTGLTFSSVGEDQNGAPSAEKTIAHIEGPAQASAREALAATIALEFAKIVGDGAFLIFIDSRQGVERVTRLIADPTILPYRSGYEAADRRRIEAALRDGKLKGVISTSALELGIDISQFVIGLNVGIPESRKALRQRMGRVGRARSGAFLLMAPASAFTQLGTTFADYYAGSVEPSHLYLENRYIQYAQARCLIEEAPELAEAGSPEGNWPSGFHAMLDCARVGGRRPADLDQLAMAGGDCPHLNYPLRQIGGEDFELKLAGSDSTRIGTIAAHQAIREAYPGATYYHLQKSYKVTEWRSTSYERSIRLRPVRDAEPTQPILRQWVNGSIDANEVIEGRLWQAASGHLAEASLQVIEAVEGYRTDGMAMLYRDLGKTNPRLRRRQRDFGTTGVLLQICEPWFSGSGRGPAASRKAIASALAALLCRERSISPREIEWAHTGVALCSVRGASRAEDTIAIYDNIRGGLRLSGPLAELLPGFAKRLQHGARVAGDDALVDATLADRFALWVASLKPSTPGAAASIDVPDGEVLIFAPESEVSFRTRGQNFERRLIAPQMMPTPDGELLFYRYEAEEGVTAWIAHDAVEPLGQHWSRAFWNPATNVIRNFA